MSRKLTMLDQISNFDSNGKFQGDSNEHLHSLIHVKNISEINLCFYLLYLESYFIQTSCSIPCSS